MTEAPDHRWIGGCIAAPAVDVNGDELGEAFDVYADEAGRVRLHGWVETDDHLAR